MRQLRALRRLSSSGAGSPRAPLEAARESKVELKPKARECSAVPSKRAPTPPPPPRTVVKEEQRALEESESESSESEEAETPVEKKKEEDKPTERCPGTFPKAKPEEKEKRSERSRERSSGGAGGHRAPRDDDLERYRKAREEATRRDRLPERSERRARSSGRHRSAEPRRRERSQRRGRDDRRRDKKVRRAGTKHKRLYRSADDPFKRFHQKPPGGYWDQLPDI